FFQDITERKQAEEALRKSEDQLRLITDATPAFISYIDRDLRFRFVNRQYEVGFGHPRADIVGKRAGEVLGGPAAEKLRPYMDRALAGERVHFEMEAHYRNMGRRFVEGFYIPDLDEKGRAKGFYVLVVDITERKRVEKALGERTRLAVLRADVNMALAGSDSLPLVLQHCAEAAVKHLDAAFARIWTLDEAGSVLEMQASAGTHVERDGPYGQVKLGEYNVGRIAQNGQPLLFNDVQRDPTFIGPDWARDEGIVAFAGYPLMLDGKVLGVMAMFATHVLSEEVLGELGMIASGISQWVQRKRTEKELRATIELNPQVPWTAGPDGTIQTFSDRWLELTGLGRNQALGDGWTNATHPSDRPAMLEAWTHSVKTGDPYDIEHRIRLGDGSYRWMRSRAFPRRDATGRIMRWYGTTEDIHDRRMAEEARGESEDRYRSLFESMDEAFCLIELLFDENDKAVDYRFVDINPAFEKQTGLKDARDKTIRELAPDIEAHWFEIYGRISRTGVPERFESASIVLNRAYEVYAFPMQTSGVHRVGIVFNDISERKRAEEVLRKSEERYRTLLESSPDCIKLMDGEGRIEMMNAKGMSLMEIDDFAPYSNQPWWLLLDDEAADTVKLAVQKAAAGDSAHFQAYCATVKGTPKWWDVVVAPIEGGSDGVKPERLISVSRDITSSKQAEQALRESEARFRAIVSHAITGVVEADATGRMTFVNQRWCEMTGYTEAELLTMNGADITVPEDLAPTLESVRQLAQGQPAYRLEKRYKRKDGSIFWADSNVNSIRGANGEFVGMVAVVLDVSERRTAEASLRLAKEQAETASRAKDNFLAALSHELRTPLNPVLMVASSLREDESLSPQVREQLAMIERNVALEARLIDDLLDLTRIVRGKLTLHAEPCDMNSLIGLVVEIVRDEAFEKRILIEVDLAAAHSSLMGDPARLQQVFWNLLRNAVKFTPPGGLVRIRSVNVGEGKNEHVCISVKDNGIGLDATTMERIFEPFEQASSGQGHRFGGLGLGLAIARAIVDLHHGSIRAESEGRGLGSTFTVDLPGATTSQLPAPPAPQIIPGTDDGAVQQTEAKMRLLVVEDHEPTMQVLTRLLRREGHEVMSASRVADAREVAAQNTFDAVISDLGLPDGTGIELMEELRQKYGLRGIMLSGYGMEEDMRRSREAGFIAHLVKPIDVNELRRGLRQLAEA
ncbi:MAG: DNA-binding response regulator, OmpR family, containings and winged-helix, partial [Verrucomicrobiaceae bacterium]|nr:DNA-binding response regulator, OmpR family, containings and winged-helix [Verrucomicrobiaceae bacterium]